MQGGRGEWQLQNKTYHKMVTVIYWGQLLKTQSVTWNHRNAESEAKASHSLMDPQRLQRQKESDGDRGKLPNF